MIPERYRVLAIAFLTMAAVVGLIRFGFTLILPNMQTGMRLSTGDMGLIASIGFLGYVVSAPFQGGLATRFGSRFVIGACLIVAGISMGLTGLANSLWLVLVLQIIAGAAAAGANVPTFTLAAPWFEAPRRGLVTGIVLGGCGFGIVVVGLLLPPLLSGSTDGWRWAWGALGVLIVLLGIAALLVLRDPAQAATTEPADRARGWTSVYRHGVVWALAMLMAAWGLSYIVYGTFFVKYLVSEIGFDIGVAGSLWALTGLVSLVSGLLGGVLSDRFGRAQTLAAMFAVQCAVHLLFVVGRTASPQWLPLVVSALLYGLTAWGFGTIMGAVTLDVVGARLAPAASGLVVFWFGVGQALGPILAGWLVEQTGTFVPVYLVSAGIVALGALGALRLAVGIRAPRPASIAAQGS